MGGGRSWGPGETQGLWGAKEFRIGAERRNYQQNRGKCGIFLKHLRVPCLTHSQGCFSCVSGPRAIFNHLGILAHSQPESTLDCVYIGKKVPAGHTGIFTRQLAPFSGLCPFCSASNEPGCNCSSRASCWGPGCSFCSPFYLYLPLPRPQQITGSPCQPQPWQGRKPGWEIPEAKGTFSVPLSRQVSNQSNIWQPTNSLDTFRSIWALNIYFFQIFSPLPLAFPLLREVCLALVRQPDPICKRKANRRVAASRPQGRDPSRASTCNIPLQILSSFQLFSVVCLASCPQGISLFNTCLLRYETRRLKWRHNILSIHI